jgi:glycosyltransferase involved in cell wall biosynthesis
MADPTTTSTTDADASRSAPSLVSVIIPVRNGERTLPEELAALTKQTYEGRWEVVVADNGSTDATRAVCAEWADRLPGFRIVDASDRPGSSHARNVGAEAAHGELLLFCDADDVVDEHWIAAMVAASLHHDLVGGVQEEGRLNDESVRRSRGARARRALVRPLGFLPFAPTSNLAVWADVYRTVGGLDIDYPQAHDVEFSWRAQLGGFDLGHAPDAVVHYRYRSTVKGVAKQAYLTGYDAVQLYRDYRADGARRPPARESLRRWAAGVVRIPLLLAPGQRIASVRLLANNVGRLVASAKFRVLFL